MPSEDVVKQVFEKLNEEKKAMGHVNIIIAGKTGVGKSTLVNAIFGKKIAETGTGSPITKEIREITAPNVPLRLYDTVGLELSKEQQITVKTDIINIIEKARRSGDNDKLIHCIWYCINTNSNRIEDEEIKFIEELAQESDIPVILVLTQSYGMNSQELKKYIENKNLPIKTVINVLASDYQIDEDYCKKAYGCDKLVEYTIEILPEAAQKAFINVQVACKKAKEKKARYVVNAVAAAAFGEGYLPIPFSDAIALVPTQVAMIVEITVVYGLEIQKSTMTAIATSLLGTTSLTILGRTIVSNILKFIPGVGTAVGGTISGATASILTKALGETYITIMNKIFDGELTEQELEMKNNMKDFSDLFKENLKRCK